MVEKTIRRMLQLIETTIGRLGQFIETTIGRKNNINRMKSMLSVYIYIYISYFIC